MTKTHEIQLKGALVQSLFWASYCAYSSFIVTMLTDYGYPPAKATAMMTATSALSFIAQPVSGYICDNYISHKKVYIALTACALPTMVLLPHTLFFTAPDDGPDAAVYHFHGADAGAAGRLGH